MYFNREISLELRIVSGQLTFVERTYVYHYLPGSVVLHVGLEWNPPPSQVNFIGGTGRFASIDEIMYRAKTYRVKHLVFDGPLDYEVAEKLISEGFYVTNRYTEPLDLPKEVNLLIVPKGKVELPERDYVEVVVGAEEQLPKDAPEDLPIHVFNQRLYDRLRQKFYYVYNHDYPLREDTRCPKCGLPVAIREMGRLIAWDGPVCRRCGYRLRFFTAELPEPPRRLLELLSWQASFVVI